MPVSKPSKLKELIDGVREWLPGVKPRALEWWETVRAEPGQIWASLAFRWGCLVAGGIVLLLIATTIAGWSERSTPSARGPAARTANFDVLCSDPNCAHHFVINRKFTFHKFPVECIKCQQPTGQRGRRCSSISCSGKLAIPVESELGPICDRCGQRFTDGAS
ncbi:MAG: hypothetical protein IID37_05930 [Planctomycetes bacterium]|nr:hypothetical protein [Planctomycetota bacterium]